MSAGNGRSGDTLGEPIYRPPAITRLVGETPTPLVSAVPTPWAVLCRAHGRVYLTLAGMEYSLEDDVYWTCPRCGRLARYDWQWHVRWVRRHGPFKRRVYVPPGFEAQLRLGSREGV